MFSSWRERLVRTFGARIALWYFALFAAGGLLILVLAGVLLEASLERRDHASIVATLVRYTNAYSRGGVTVLQGVTAADRAAGSYEPVFVRVLAAGRTRMLSIPREWTRFDLDELVAPAPGGSTFQHLDDGSGTRLEVASSQLGDGTLFQVGRSTALRDAVLERYRETALLLFAAIVLVGLTGGFMLTARALRPLEELTDTIVHILQTGRTSERVPVRETADPLDALGALVNRMLDRIDGLVRGMRSTLDNVAHDLRTPLTRLRGTAEVALQSARSPEEYRNALADCLEEAERVAAILDALMDLAEAETGAMRLQRDQVDLASVIRDAAELYEAVAEDKGLTLTVDAGAGGLPIVGDRARLTQVVANLIDNAVKYTPAPGQVTVTGRVAEPTLVRGDASDGQSAEGGVEVIVADTGLGIAATDLPRIWERLYRGDRSRSQRGLGIGLSLVRAIVEAHGGRVTAESQIGRGSRFLVWLPREMTQM
jgi:signal transduction histidine kinase